MKRLLRLVFVNLRAGWLLAALCSAALHLPRLAAAGPAETAGKDWGRVAVEKNAQGLMEAVLENSKIRVRYALYTPYKGPQEIVIREFLIKSLNKNLAKSKIGIDAAAWRGILKEAVVVRDDAERKTIRMVWQSLNEKPQPEEEVSIFPDSAFIEIRYISFNVNSVDLSGGGSTYVVHGADQWVRGYVPYPKHYYNRAEGHIENIVEADAADGGPLNYHGNFILGICDEPSGTGWGRVMPVKAGAVIKLLVSGYEIFPWYRQKHQEFSAYIFAVTGGKAEVESMGRELADRLNQEAAPSPAGDALNHPRG